MGFRADRARGAVAGRRARIDSVRRHEQVRVDAEIGGRIAERAAAGVAGDDGSFDLRWPAEQPRGALDIPSSEQLAEGRRRDSRHELDPLDGEPQLLEGVEVTAARSPE